MGDETDKAAKKIVLALSEIQSCADWESATVDVEAEIRKVGAVNTNTGRDILVIRVPYTRNRRFLERQLSIAAANLEALTSMMALARTEIDEINCELAKNSQNEPDAHV